MIVPYNALLYLALIRPLFCIGVTLRAETFAGRNFRVSKKTRNLWNKLSRFAVFGTNFVEKTFANRGKSLFSREKTFANEQKK